MKHLTRQMMFFVDAAGEGRECNCYAHYCLQPLLISPSLSLSLSLSLALPLMLSLLPSNAFPPSLSLPPSLPLSLSLSLSLSQSLSLFVTAHTFFLPLIHTLSSSRSCFHEKKRCSSSCALHYALARVLCE